ncbi:MAG TPA: YceD family protein [Rhodoblastus sp.]|nr:YceD family protein [Rhodoblastus sp.]
MSKAEHQREAPVWSSPLVVSEIPPQGADIVIEADAAQRAALAKLNGLVGLASATARLHVAPRGRERLHVTGEVRARVTQTCVVSLEPFESEIVEPVDVEFEPARAKPVREEPERMSRRRRDARPPVEEDEEGMDDLDAPDEIVDGKVDLGALASEFLTLGIDPYPRKPGVAFEEPQPQGAVISPFAPLAGRKSEPGAGT